MKKLVRIAVGGVERFARNRWTGLAVSGILIATASIEIFESVTEIRAHHGILVFGLANLFRTLPDFLDSATLFEEVEMRDQHN